MSIGAIAGILVAEVTFRVGQYIIIIHTYSGSQKVIRKVKNVFRPKC